MSRRFSQHMREQRADAIAREAARALTEDGCFRFNVDDVASAAGVGKGTVYLHFASKSDLIGASLRRSCEQLLSKLADRVEPVADAPGRLMEAVRVLASVAVDHPELEVLLDRRLPCAAAWAGAEVAPYVAVEGYLRALVADAQRAGALDSTLAADFAAQAILAAASVSTWRRLAAAGGAEHGARQIMALLGALHPSQG